MDLSLLKAIFSLFSKSESLSAKEIKDELEDEGYTDRRVVAKHIEFLAIKGDLKSVDKEDG